MRKRHRGFTLVELVMSIVIIGVAMGGIISVIGRTTRSSADPMLERQAIAIAEAYLEEILAKSYTVQPGTGTRDQFDDIGDYSALPDTTVRSQSGEAIGELSTYSVTVTVAAEAALNGVNARRIDVTVTPPVGSPVTLTGYRTNW
jgi:MSHA pilin protein MshD